MNPFPVLPSLVVGRPLLNELASLGAWSASSAPLESTDAGDTLEKEGEKEEEVVVVVVVDVLAKRAWGVKRVDEKVWGVDEDTLCMAGA